MSVSLYTIGYEGAHFDHFLATLQAASIEHVIDVRDVPISRKRGFSKKSLSQALGGVSIGYTHLKPLGDPKPGREAMRRGDFAGFERIYNCHLTLPEAQRALQTAVDIARDARSVLLCYERAPQQCHRSIIAKNMGDLFIFSVHHLGVNGNVPQRLGTSRYNPTVGMHGVSVLTL